MRRLASLVAMGFLIANAMVLVSAETEPNDTTGQAETLAGSGTYMGRLNGTDYDDYFTVALTAGQTLTVNLTVPPEDQQDVGGYQTVSILNATGDLMDDVTVYPNPTGSPKTDSVTWTTNSALANGTFYIHVDNFAGGGGEGNYNITVSITSQNEAGKTNFDAPDTLANVPVITPGTWNGYLKDSDEDDYYRVNVTPGQTINASLTVPA